MSKNLTVEEVEKIWGMAEHRIMLAYDTKAEIPDRQVMRLCVEFAEAKLEIEEQANNHDQYAWQSLLTRINKEER